MGPNGSNGMEGPVGDVGSEGPRGDDINICQHPASTLQCSSAEDS